MPIIKEGWAEALEPGIREWFSWGANDGLDIIPTLFNVVPSGGSSEHYHSFGSINSDAWDHFRKNKQVPTVDMDAGFKTSLENLTYMVDMPVEAEFIEDEMYNLIQSMTEELGASAFNKRQTDAINIFNNSSDSDFVGGDGVSLVNASHPNGPNKSGVQTNTFALALSKANLRVVRLAMIAFTNDIKEKVGVMPDMVIVHPDLEDTLDELIESELDPSSANNAINPDFLRNWKKLVLPRLSDTNKWFVVDSARMKRHLIWQERIDLNIRLRIGDPAAFAVYRARMRYGNGWSDWRWCAGSNP